MIFFLGGGGGGGGVIILVHFATNADAILTGTYGASKVEMTKIRNKYRLSSAS